MRPYRRPLDEGGLRKLALVLLGQPQQHSEQAALNQTALRRTTMQCNRLELSRSESTGSMGVD